MQMVVTVPCRCKLYSHSQLLSQLSLFLDAGRPRSMMQGIDVGPAKEGTSGLAPSLNSLRAFRDRQQHQHRGRRRGPTLFSPGSIAPCRASATASVQCQPLLPPATATSRESSSSCFDLRRPFKALPRYPGAVRSNHSRHLHLSTARSFAPCLHACILFTHPQPAATSRKPPEAALNP
jgi:hypothetical protein